jgi:hypothetical protein
MPGSITQDEGVQDARGGGAKPHESLPVIFARRADVSTGPSGGVSGTIEIGSLSRGPRLLPEARALVSSATRTTG